MSIVISQCMSHIILQRDLNLKCFIILYIQNNLSNSDSNLEFEYQNLPINLATHEVNSLFACESMNIAKPRLKDITQLSASTLQPFQQSKKVSQYYYPCMADGRA